MQDDFDDIDQAINNIIVNYEDIRDDELFLFDYDIEETKENVSHRYDYSKEVVMTFEEKDIDKILKYVNEMRCTKWISNCLHHNNEDSIEYLLYDFNLRIKNIVINKNEHLYPKKTKKRDRFMEYWTYTIILENTSTKTKEDVFINAAFGDWILFQDTDLIKKSNR